MTEPSQYFKGRTVQEQMDEVIGYVDKRAEEVAAAKADAVLQPAEAAKTAAQAAAEAAEAAKDTTLAALPQIRQDIAGLKAEDTALDGRLNTVELKVQTAEGNIVTIQGQIVALQTADGQNVKINNINQYAVGLTGNQNIDGTKNFVTGLILKKMTSFDRTAWPTSYKDQEITHINDVNGEYLVQFLMIGNQTAAGKHYVSLNARVYKADGNSVMIQLGSTEFD